MADPHTEARNASQGALNVHDGALMLTALQGKGGGRRLLVSCFGRKRHYEKDGSCPHTRRYLAMLTPYWRGRTTVTPFGDKHADYELVARRKHRG